MATPSRSGASSKEWKQMNKILRVLLCTALAVPITGAAVIGTGAAGAQASLTPLAENARQAVHQAAKAVTEATAPKPPVPPAS